MEEALNAIIKSPEINQKSLGVIADILKWLINRVPLEEQTYFQTNSRLNKLEGND